MDLFHPILFSSLLDPNELMSTLGFWGLTIIIFLESAFLPAPGDSLLFVAGVFAFRGDIPLGWTLLATTLAGIAGNQAGYWFGRKVGVALYNRPDSRFFKKEHLDKTHAYFERFGPKTILLARVIPVVRGLAPIIAGVGRMEYRTFVVYNVLGSILWCFGFILLGYYAGDAIGAENIDKYVLPLAAVVVIVTSIPLYFEYRRNKKHFASTEPIGAAKGEIVDDEPVE
jgi:membrane-associated protein